ncbi:MAG: hypothetical protein HGA37_11465 [Lentimicrobium sp.]|nr:hypothetical protein [Lentimicrobium sp.]
MLFILVYGVSLTKAQDLNQEDSLKKKSFKMTTLTLGGNGVNITKINNQLSVMTGGRGSATFNNRYTIGGGGWGMIKGVEVESDTRGIYNFVKMGYGGIDFGYIFLNGKKFILGTKLLIAGGAVFKETVPESKGNGFKMFPVLEPAIYCQIPLSKLFRVEMGASYRYIRGTNLSYISDSNLGGFSFYAGFLVSACKCN